MKASGAPHKALALDNIIASVVEPGMSSEDKALRAERRTAWAAKADETHKSWETLLNRAATAGKPPAATRASLSCLLRACRWG